MDVTPTDRDVGTTSGTAAGVAARVPSPRQPSRQPARQTARQSPRPPPRPADLTLNMLAQRRATHLLRNRAFTRASSSRAVSGLLVVAVRSVSTPTGPRWFLAPSDTGPATQPAWSAHEPAGTEFDHALRVDLLLRLVPPGPPPGVAPAGQPAVDAAQAIPSWSMALLVERRGPCVVDDGDIAWWQSFVYACGIVGRVPAASLVVCATGIRDIAAGRTVDPT